MSNLENTSLMRITRCPLDVDAEAIRAYPAFKLGAEAVVRHYAERLLPLAKRLIAGASGPRDWIMTAPAIVCRTPAAANLLCRELFEICMQDREITNGKEITFIEIPQEIDSPDS